MRGILKSLQDGFLVNCNGPWKAGQNRKSWLENHLSCPNDKCLWEKQPDR